MLPVRQVEISSEAHQMQKLGGVKLAFSLAKLFPDHKNVS